MIGERKEITVFGAQSAARIPINAANKTWYIKLIYSSAYADLDLGSARMAVYGIKITHR